MLKEKKNLYLNDTALFHIFFFTCSENNANPFHPHGTLAMGALNTTSFSLLPQNPKPISLSRVSSFICRAFTKFPGDSDSDDSPDEIPGRRSNYSGVKLEETVDSKTGKLRLDSWVSSRIDGVSRARVQSSIRSGLVFVNGRVTDKVSHMVKGGDKVDCTIADLKPLRAEPEDIPLDIVYEDDHVLVVNKPAHMVVHPAPGNATGTLVSGILHHCSLPTVSFPGEEVLSDGEDASDDELNMFSAYRSPNYDDSSVMCESSVRPGIVHRLDKGTSGLLVVAKNEHSLADLAEQFKKHTIKRVYVSITCGVPASVAGRVDIPIGRDSNNRIRMAAIPGTPKSGKSRHAVSRYKVIEKLAGGSSALVEWRLETGRTHQIRAHAKHLGIPLMGDEVYGGTKNMALSLLQPKTPPMFHGKLSQLVSQIDRPCLHALTLGFRHPFTGENLHITRLPPPDFAEILSELRAINTEKVL
ncbi:RNA pseudouridine synthase 2, chloroplastic isoform X2 [Solanum pennellii]|uniref:RNA pseudouridine synthase 2, chloroplastic isoform X2 n=1 Tax=Solanum pennellii TaxID=28526 RepID=A0ABM1GP28_SOLPN|nr:RNA pseudouridine synthase 2, chloroplastic isoform X2 [Solanum pennellii]